MTEYYNINNTLVNSERVTSTYAEIYFNDVYHSAEIPDEPTIEKETVQHVELKEEWISPSDLLIDIIKLNPPFTSKITRGKTHEGILAIGNNVLENERAKFLKSLTKLLQDNDGSWNLILDYEKQEILKKVKVIFQNIFKDKSNIVKQEISLFYESSLQDLEKHLISEIQITLQTVYANIISDLNRQIQHKLSKEKQKLENILRKNYATEIEKIKKYYSLLLNNESYRNNKFINQSIQERNEALRAFYKQIEAERITSTMYIMSLERKKCKVQKMVLQNLHSGEILNKKQQMEENVKLIEDFKQKHIGISDINREWEQKIKKIMQLFLKFISFSLKLLPEQTTFLLDLERLTVLQLNEIRKKPVLCSSLLVDEKLETNIFKFEKGEKEQHVCENDPFILVGDLSDPIPKRYGSRETLPLDIDLPYFRVGRQYIYAKCHGYEDIKKYLDSQKCNCRVPREISTHKLDDIEVKSHTSSETIQQQSSFESIPLNDFECFEDCPVRKCQKWIKILSFPNLASYLDYSEENFRRVTTILGSVPNAETSPDLINPKDIANSELPFSATKELYHSIATQYSSQEDLSLTQMTCTCIENILKPEIEFKFKRTSDHKLDDIMAERNKSVEQLINKNPNLLKIFTDESFDYKL